MNIRHSEGSRQAFDQVLFLAKTESGDGYWLDHVESRYTRYRSLGSKDRPGLFLDETTGPHFREPEPWEVGG